MIGGNEKQAFGKLAARVVATAATGQAHSTGGEQESPGTAPRCPPAIAMTPFLGFASVGGGGDDDDGDNDDNLQMEDQNGLGAAFAVAALQSGRVSGVE